MNGWTEQHSPRKILHSPSKSRFLDSLREMMEHEDRDAPESPTSSPKKGRNRSPKKTDAEKRATAARKTFESEKHAIASKFLEELDRKITGGKIGEMANDGKGVNLEWNRKLNSTAGRAHWRKEGRREKDSVGHENGEIKFRHEAKIELAEKVIDCEGWCYICFSRDDIRCYANLSRTLNQCHRARVLPSCLLHDQRYSRQSSWQRVQGLVSHSFL